MSDGAQKSPTRVSSKNNNESELVIQHGMTAHIKINTNQIRIYVVSRDLTWVQYKPALSFKRHRIHLLRIGYLSKMCSTNNCVSISPHDKVIQQLTSGDKAVSVSAFNGPPKIHIQHYFDESDKKFRHFIVVRKWIRIG